MCDETDLAESLEGEEGEATTFPFSCMWWASILIIFILWEDYTSECAGEIWTFGLIGGGGVGRGRFGQPRCWETVG
jgi:hypothetical protein